MWLADSNIIICAATVPGHPLQNWLLDELPAISVVTRIEVLGYHRLRPDAEILLRALLSSLDEHPITARTAVLAIALRQQRKISLGDSLIAATCLEHGLQLATHNASDFNWIPGLGVDPLDSFSA
jgi:hypothetical protein